MRVVLRELAHAHDAVKRAMRLVPVAAAELRHAQRQVAIGFDPLTEHLNMRPEEQTSELQQLMRISYPAFCLQKKKKQNTSRTITTTYTHTTIDYRSRHM